MPGWVDSHSHLFMSEEDPEVLLKRASAAGVEWVMCPGTDLSSSLAARAVAQAHPGRVLWSAGLHPHDASRWDIEGKELQRLAAEAAAVGECGLDFYRNLSSHEDQRTAFRAQLELAASLSKPVIVHCRDAFAEVYEDLERVALGERAVLHCWTGGPRWTKRFRDLGVSFSYAGPLTYETADAVRLGARHAPRDRTMVETDTPFLTPPPDRQLPNEPANVVKVGAVLAEVWGVEGVAVAAATSATATRIFGGPRS